MNQGEPGLSYGTEGGTDTALLDEPTRLEPLPPLEPEPTPENPREEPVEKPEVLSDEEFALGKIRELFGEGDWKVSHSEILSIDERNHFTKDGFDYTSNAEKNVADGAEVKGDFSQAKATEAKDQLALHNQAREYAMRRDSTPVLMTSNEIPDKDGTTYDEKGIWVWRDGKEINITARLPIEIKIKPVDEGSLTDLNNLFPIPESPAPVDGTSPNGDPDDDDNLGLDLPPAEIGAFAAADAGVSGTEIISSQADADEEVAAPIEQPAFTAELILTDEPTLAIMEIATAPIASVTSIENVKAPEEILVNISPEAIETDLLPPIIESIVVEQFEKHDEEAHIEVPQVKVEASEPIVELQFTSEDQKVETVTAPLSEPQVFEVTAPAVESAPAVQAEVAPTLPDAHLDESRMLEINVRDEIKVEDVATVETLVQEREPAVISEVELSEQSSQIETRLEFAHEETIVSNEAAEVKNEVIFDQKEIETISLVLEHPGISEVKETKIEDFDSKNVEQPKEAESVLAVLVEKSDAGINLMKLTEAGIKAREAGNTVEPAEAKVSGIADKEVLNGSPDAKDNIIRGRFEGRSGENSTLKVIKTVDEKSGITATFKLPVPRSFRPVARQAA